MGRKAIGLVAVGVLLVSGCAASPTDSPSTTPTPVATASTTSSASASADASTDATRVAVDALTAFVNHDRPKEEWWADFSQYLSPEALYVWDGVRADRVTASVIVGDATTTVSDATFVSVIIPTDIGSYRLDMAKRVDGSAEGTWLVFEMVAPEASE